MLSKYTVIGLIVGGIITVLGLASLVDSLANPNEIREINDTFGVGDSDKIRFNAPADKADFSWINTISGENIIQVQNTGKSEFNISGTFELSRDPLFFTYHILVIIAGIVVIGFSAAFSAKKPRGF